MMVRRKADRRTGSPVNENGNLDFTPPTAFITVFFSTIAVVAFSHVAGHEGGLAAGARACPAWDLAASVTFWAFLFHDSSFVLVLSGDAITNHRQWGTTGAQKLSIDGIKSLYRQVHYCLFLFTQKNRVRPKNLTLPY
jgi:hypothetical protein